MGDKTTPNWGCLGQACNCAEKEPWNMSAVGFCDERLTGFGRSTDLLSVRFVLTAAGQVLRDLVHNCATLRGS